MSANLARSPARVGGMSARAGCSQPVPRRRNRQRRRRRRGGDDVAATDPESRSELYLVPGSAVEAGPVEADDPGTVVTLGILNRVRGVAGAAIALTRAPRWSSCGGVHGPRHQARSGSSPQVCRQFIPTPAVSIAVVASDQGAARRVRWLARWSWVGPGSSGARSHPGCRSRPGDRLWRYRLRCSTCRRRRARSVVVVTRQGGEAGCRDWTGTD